MISRKAISEHLAQYRRFGIGERWSERITYIRNGISLPQDPVAKTFDGPVLRVLYAGRGGTEKRVHLVADIADACRSAGMPVQFTFMGDVRDALRPGQSDSGELLGNVTDQDRVAQVYRDSDILILTSSEEGFPMVVMEAMARGLVILATPVGDLPAHVHDGEAGYLFSSVTDEDRIRTEGVSRIAQLLSDRALCRRISQHNVEYARLHFGLDRFEESYRNLPDNQTH
jgi:glycosyltransferase involved in cell wall biosynthesis